MSVETEPSDSLDSASKEDENNEILASGFYSRAGFSKKEEVAAFLQALDKSQAMICFDINGTILEANSNFLSAVGYSLDEVKGQHHSIFVSSDYKKSKEYQQFWQSLRMGRIEEGLIQRFGKSGTELWLKATYNPISNEHGQTTKIVKLATDVTGHQQTQNQVADLVKVAAKGDLSHRIDTRDLADSDKEFAEMVNALMDHITDPIKEVSNTVQQLVKGDLTQRIEGEYEGDFLKLKTAVNSSFADLCEVVAGIRVSATDISSSSKNLREGNANLSLRTERQAASLEQTASSMEELASTMKANAENAQNAEELSSDAKTRAQNGGDVVTNAISAMDDINTASKKIADIVGVIDEIAFQTNLLALNAAVEAARAGEQGRGFAVVATEVRNLAQRSAASAKEIKVLIHDSVEKVGEGSQLVNKSGDVLKEIVDSVVKVSDIIAEITLASKEQSAGIDQVNSAITDIDSVTQENKSLVEEATAASSSMNEQALKMQSQVEHFVTDRVALSDQRGYSTMRSA